MESTDLRVTNFVRYDDVEMPIAMIGFNAVQLYTPQGSTTVTAQLDLIKPIPINNNTLLRLGFDRYKETGHYKIESHKYYPSHDHLNLKQGYLRIKLTKAGNYRVESLSSKSIYLKSVHQLQNLFYAITARELIFISNG